MIHPHNQQPKAATKHLLWAFVIEPLLGSVFMLLLLGATGVLSFYLCGGGRN